MTQTPEVAIQSITLTGEAVQDILCTGYIDYWARESWYGKRDEDGKHISLFAIDDEDGKEYEATKEGIEKAIVEILSGKHVNTELRVQCMSEVVDYLMDSKYGIGFDSDLSDCIIQIACFDKVIYG